MVKADEILVRLQDLPEVLRESLQIPSGERYPATKDARLARELSVRVVNHDLVAVDRHFDEWHHLLDNDIDLLFGNEEELLTLTKAKSHAEAIEMVRGRCEILCATKGAEGSLIITADETIEIPAVPVVDVVDTTGAACA